MDENRIEGAARERVGRAQASFGDAMDDPESQVRGRINQAMGRAQNVYGQAADRARTANDWVSENPWPAAGIGLAAGLLIGLILAS
ncbi:MAG TPA: CsbD family protein [Caulobacteraceae bacterium]